MYVVAYLNYFITLEKKKRNKQIKKKENGIVGGFSNGSAYQDY
jgi:hypothetical protein